MSDSLKKLYEEHHSTARDLGYSIMKGERGNLFAKLVGTGKRVLDLGCRDGSLTTFFAKGNKVLGVDIDEVSLKRARENVGIETVSFDIQSDWTALSGKTFDAVVAGEFLEHIYYPDKVTAKVARVLTPEGIFVGSVPNAFSLKNRLRYLKGTKKYTPLSDPTHINHFSVKDLREMFLKHFKECEIIGLGRYAFLARHFPNYFAFDLAFLAKNPRG